MRNVLPPPLATGPMPSHSALTRRAVLVLLVAGAAPALAQHGGAHGTTVRINENDSVAFVTARRPARESEASIRTRDRHATLILRDTFVVLQLTDAGMDSLFAADTVPRTGGAAIIARMMRAGVSGLLDHGIAYRLTALRRARSDGHRLLLEDVDGKAVFDDTEVNGRRPMHDFDAGEAQRFAAAVQRAIDAARR